MAKEEYRPLMDDEALEEGDTAELKQQSAEIATAKRYAPPYRCLVYVVVVQSLLLVLGLMFFVVKKVPSDDVCSRVLYSPALDVVEPQIKVFHVGFPGDLSPFQIPSSPALDDAWEELYGFGISRITKNQAARLPNKTQPIPGDEEYYIAELDVFHNLHCLNMVRKALDPAYYPEWNTTANEKSAQHVSHCIDWIRQSIMCHADTSVIVWQWEDWINSSIVKGDIAHTCRNFEKIQDWAKERQLPGQFNPNVHLKDDIVIPVLHANDL
ncbi:hypothetical protein VNI00_014645 [Paramarasmius palmivorus]|uniref:Tat pathway signal sequence n=1 Tax=Paramarasmius palmivorus TaxID=297713 RepID=A0AAW0BTE6_9AGAR